MIVGQPVSLAVWPEIIRLSGPQAMQQIIVTGRYRDGGAPADQAEQKALTHLCHMLLNTSEFLYVP